MDAIGHEVKGRSALHRDGRTSMVREYEGGDVVGRVLAPPSPPTVVGPGVPHRPEHVAAHDPGAEVVEAACGEVVGHFLECLRAEDPLVQRHPSDAHRVGQILVGTGAMTVDGDSKCVYPKP